MNRTTLGLSFGFLINEDRKAADSVRELLALDLLEISLTPQPANDATRVVSWKSATTSPAAQRRELAALLEGVATESKSALPTRPTGPISIASFEV